MGIIELLTGYFSPELIGHGIPVKGDLKKRKPIGPVATRPGRHDNGLGLYNNRPVLFKIKPYSAGDALLEAASRLARERGAKTINLTSNPSRKAANHPYRKAGFEQRDTNAFRKVL